MKEKQNNDIVFLQLKNIVHKQKVKVFYCEEDGILQYHGMLYVSGVDKLKTQNLFEAHNLRYSIHLLCTKMYDDLRKSFSRVV